MKSLAQTTAVGSNALRFNGIAETYRYIVDRDGITGLYRGFSYKLLMNALNAMTETFFVWVDQKVTPRNPLMVFPAALGTLLFCLGVFVPIDIALNHIRLQAGEEIKSSLGEVLGDIYKREGLRGWYKGQVGTFWMPMLVYMFI